MSGSIAALSANAATNTAQTPSLAGDFNTFLTLLTTQIKNQTPTDPLDVNQMTNQLVQFASVEQQIAMNQNLKSLVSLEQASQLTASAPLIGRKVEVDTTQISLQSGSGALKLPPAGSSQTAQITIRGTNNQIVRQETIQLGSAPTTWSWDGLNGSGVTMPDGAYNASVTGIGAGGKTEALPFTSLATVTGAERANGELQLLMGQMRAGFDKLRSVSAGN